MDDDMIFWDEMWNAPPKKDDGGKVDICWSCYNPIIKCKCESK